MTGKTPFDDATIEFPLDQGDVISEHPLVYRPWGTRTLKVRVTTSKAMPERKLRIRPRNVDPDEVALGWFRAYADEGKVFKISWGGGHELGPCANVRKNPLEVFEECAPLDADESNYIFFNVTHTGVELPPEATVTLEAFEYDDETKQKIGQSVATLAVKLQMPSNMPAPNEIMRVGGGIPWEVSAGRYLPTYDSRWWPAKDVTYEVSEAPPLSIHLEDDSLLIKWADREKPIATIEDYTDPSVLHEGASLAFELFTFDEYSVVLRVWFFWVDKYIGREVFPKRHEVPDAERFDLIIVKTGEKEGRVILAGTDLHWREVWGKVRPKKALRATLGMPRETMIELVRRKWTRIWNSIWVKWAKVFKKREAEPESRNNPVDPYVRLMAKQEATTTLKEQGFEAHIPMLHGLEQRHPPQIISSDVRLG